MPELFESTSIKNLELPNRFVRSATWEGLATEDGFVTQRLLDLSAQLAQGGTGLLISGHAYVSREGQATPFQLAASADEYVPGLREVAQTVHDFGGKILMQLNHAGCFAPVSRTKLEPIGPSPAATKDGPVGRQMTPRRSGRSWRLSDMRQAVPGTPALTVSRSTGPTAIW